MPFCNSTLQDHLCRSIRTSSITSLFAHLHAVLHSPASRPDFTAWFIHPVLLGCRKPPGEIRVSKPPYVLCTICESFKGERAVPHGGARKAWYGGRCIAELLYSFTGDRGGKICWCCIQHRGWSWFRSTFQTSAPKPNSPWLSLFHSVDLYPLVRCKNRETSVNIHSYKYSGIKKRGCT